MPSRLIRVTIGPEPPARLDKALSRDVPDDAHLSRSRIARLIEAGCVRRGGAALREPKARVSAGDVIEIDVPSEAPADIGPEAMDLRVVHEDDDLAVIDKPAGLVVHPAPGSPSGTLVNGLMHHFGARLSGVGGVQRPGIVHRIDKDTSGLLVVAKTDRAHHALSEQFAAHTVERLYRAICHGVPDPSAPRLAHLPGVRVTSGRLTVATQIGRHPTDRQRQAVLRSGGRHAVTHIEVVRGLGAAALVECRLETGRTHQIRVHMRHLGHPLVGDATYGGQRRAAPHEVHAALSGFARQALHAATLGFAHPATGETLRFASPLPGDMADLLSRLDRIANNRRA